MQFHAPDYHTRGDLVAAVQAECGLDLKANREAGHLITGTRDELARLQLSDTTNVYGVRCVITDTPTAELAKQKPSPKPSKNNA